LFVDSTVIYVPILALPREVEHFYRVNQHSLLDFVVERGVSHEAWRLIHFDEPWFSFFVDKNVDTEYLKA